MNEVKYVRKWLFEIIVNHMGKDGKISTTYLLEEADDKGLDLFMKSGLRFCVTVTPFSFADEEKVDS